MSGGREGRDGGGATTAAGGRGCRRAVTCGCPGGAGRSCASSPGRPGAPDGRAAARLDGDGRPQLVRLLPAAGRALPRHRPRPPRPRPRACARPSRSASSSAPTTSPRSPPSSGIDRIVPVGYSMGGPIAQLVWRRHPDLVDGLVLCATSATFTGTVRERLLFGVAAGTERGGQRRPARPAHERRPRPLDRLAAPPRLPRGGASRRSPATTGPRSSRPGGRSVRFDSRRWIGARRRADRGRRHRRRRASCPTRAPAGPRRPHPRRAAFGGCRRPRRVHDVAGALRARRCSPPAAARRRRARRWPSPASTVAA